MLRAEIEHTIPFHDIDVLHIAWHGHYYKYFELARTALFQSIDLDIPKLIELGYAMPVIESGAKYRKPAKYSEKILIEASLEQFHLAALEIHYRITSKGGLIAEGFSRQAYYDMKSSETILTVPTEILSAYEAAKRKLDEI